MRIATMIAAAVAALVAAGAAPVTGQPAGTPGFCSDDHGTTVVVDFTALGGDVVVRCAPGSAERTGFDALEDAGFDVDGTTRFGEGAVCRIDGRPAADDALTVEGDDGYREACIDMPPSAAYWSYWSADNGGAWSYSQYGAQNREAIDGGFEGWSFALNSGSAGPPAPGIDPVRPASSTDDANGGDAADGGSGNEGGTDHGDDSADGGGTNGGDADASRGESTGGKGLPKPLKRDTSPAPTSGTQNGVEWSGSSEPSQDDAASTSTESGSGVVPWVAGGVLGVLAVLIGVTTVRRRRRREATSP